MNRVHRPKFSRPALLALLLCAPTLAQSSPRWGKDYFPNVPLVTQDGETVRFFDDVIKDKVVMINFIYTSCPNSCPLETARLLEVKAILGDRVGRDVFMYSITIDPERDTPEVLHDYAERYQTGPGWTFLTGKDADIRLLRQKLGLYIPDIQDDSNDHNLSLIIGNQATGRWRKASTFDSPYVLASQVGGWLTNWKVPLQGESDYATAPKLRDLSRGEVLFRTRCTACHVIGSSNGTVATGTGPNLLGVTERRDQSWLMNWLRAPEDMLAKKDPIATKLFEQYKGVTMPNMQLNQFEAGSLLEYIDAESRRVAAAAKVDPLVASLTEPTSVDSCCEKNESVMIGDKSQEIVADADPKTLGRETPKPAFSTASLLSIGLGLGLGLFSIVFGGTHRQSGNSA